jgi:hypothetical protein
MIGMPLTITGGLRPTTPKALRLACVVYRVAGLGAIASR